MERRVHIADAMQNRHPEPFIGVSPHFDDPAGLETCTPSLTSVHIIQLQPPKTDYITRPRTKRKCCPQIRVLRSSSVARRIEDSNHSKYPY